MSNPVYIAFYKGKARKKKGKWLSWIRERAEDAVIRLVTFSKYSHCELVVAIGDGRYECYAASPRDNGVRKRTMKLPDDRWDIFPIENVMTYDENQHTYEQLDDFFHQHVGKGYDMMGAIGSVLGIKHNKNRYFCSEFIADWLNFPNPHTYTPSDLYRLAKNK